MFELRKDINTPDGYVRAGTQKTKEEWQQLFPKAFQFGDNNEWFIDLTVKEEPKQEQDLARDIVNEIFEKNGLHSVSYKNAAMECCHEYLRKVVSMEVEKKN